MSAVHDFTSQFEALVAALRREPALADAETRTAAAAAALPAGARAVLESGVEVLGADDPWSLKSRLLRRHVDILTISAGVGVPQLLRLARALAHDSLPVIPAEHIEITFVPVLARDPDDSYLPIDPSPAPVEPSFTPTRDGGDRRLRPDRRSVLSGANYRGAERRKGERRRSGERRLIQLKHQEEDLQRFHERLARAVQEAAWSTALHAAHAIVRILPDVPAEARRRAGILLRRALPREAIEGICGIAIRDSHEAPRAAEVLRWLGPDAAEVMVDAVMETEGVGGRRVLYDILGGMPAAYPLVMPYFTGGRPHQIAHAAELLGRLGNPEAIEPLKRRLDDADDRIRSAVILALAEFPLGDVADALRSALASPSPATRAVAADAIGRRRSGAFAMPLIVALEQERDVEAWRATVRALGAMTTPDAATGLLRVAMARRSFLSGKGFPAEQRVEAVRALGVSAAPGAVQALERIAREGDEPVREAARRALMERGAAVVGR